MVDAVTTDILVDGSKVTVMKFTNVSDGTGESAVTKVDVSALVGSPSEVKIKKLWYSTVGMAVDIFWDATADVIAFGIPQDNTETLDFKEIGGIPNNAGAGKTGDINFSTNGHTNGDSYSITLWLEKS